MLQKNVKLKNTKQCKNNNNNNKSKTNKKQNKNKTKFRRTTNDIVEMMGSYTEQGKMSLEYSIILYQTNKHEKVYTTILL